MIKNEVVKINFGEIEIFYKKLNWSRKRGGSKSANTLKIPRKFSWFL